MIRLAVPLILFVGLAIILFSGLGRDRELVPSPLVGRPAPAFDLPTLYDPQRRISRDSLLGKPYLLNIWGSWCPTCVVEHPVISDIAKSGKVAVYGLNWKDESVDAKRWLDRFGDPYVASLVDYNGDVAIEFGVYKAPETFLIDPQGVVRHKVIGEVTPEIWQNDLLPRIEDM